MLSIYNKFGNKDRIPWPFKMQLIAKFAVIVRARPLMIWGGEKIEKKNFEGPSPGKKISRGLPGKKINFKRPRRGKKNLKRPSRKKNKFKHISAREKKNFKHFFDWV